MESGRTDKVNFNCHAELVSASVPCRKLPVTLDRSRNKFGMTLQKITMSCGFTMAEILLSLTIIGVVAAITLPSLTGNINERTWNTQRKALYARLSQAISLMPALNGYGTLKEESSSGAGDAVDTAAETFVTAGLSKVLKINNICDNEHLEDCGVPEKITALNGSTINDFTSTKNTLVALNNMFNGVFIEGAYQYPYSQTDTKAAAFETANGESIVVYYNPHCAANMQEVQWHHAQPKMCANFIYDLNGKKGPNTVGKDIGFITVLYPTDSVVVAPLPLPSNAGSTSHAEVANLCIKQDPESRVPNIDELSAMFYNKLLIGIEAGYFWSSTVISPEEAWQVRFESGRRNNKLRMYGAPVRCVKR